MIGSNNASRLFVLAGLALSSSAFGATRSWLNAAGGFVSTPANWSPAAMPVAADILNFNLATTYSVVFDASVPIVNSDNFGPGTISISATSPHTATSQFGIFSGGTVTLTAGSFTSNGVISVNSSGSGTFTVTGPTASMNGTSLTALLRVGNGIAGTTGTLNILDGGLVQTAGGISVGAFSSSQGTVLVSGVNGSTPSRLVTTDLTAGDITLGSAGNGFMTATAGGTVTCADDLSIAPNPSFTGNLTVGSASTVTVAGDMPIGATGTLSTSGVVNVGAVITQGGTFTMTGGTVSATNFNAQNGSSTTASGRIDASVLGPLSTGTGALTLNGPLDAGRPVGGGFGWNTALNVGSHALTIRSNSQARLGDVTIAGGSITPTGGLGTGLANGDSLIGFGTINGRFEFTPGSTVTATGTGLIFNGPVATFFATAAVSIAGTKVKFGASGGFTGNGSISSTVENLGTISANGPLTIGDAGPLGVITTLGALTVGLHHVTLLDSNGLGVGQCTLGGGNLELIGTFSGRTLHTGTNGHLRGFGTITSLLVQNVNGGQISPGNPGATGTGALFFTGNFNCGDALNPAGTLNIDLRDSESIDQLIITGSAAVDGTLNITLDSGFTPAPGDRFTFLRAASVSGNFDTLNIPAGSVILYNPDNIQILFPCPSDFNQDGTVDFFDYLDFVDAFSNADPSADFNGDTSIDFFDYLDFVDAFSLGC